jgi:hypothetical protein
MFKCSFLICLRVLVRGCSHDIQTLYLYFVCLSILIYLFRMNSINKFVVRGIGLPNYSNVLEDISVCIYCGTTKHRKIYENHFGQIPKESNGRTYEIHHIDGNHSNNNPLNLTAVTLQEHYDIHYAREDYRACYLMALRMAVSVEELSELARKNSLKQVKNGKHPFSRRPDGSSITSDRVNSPNYVNPFSKSHFGGGRTDKTIYHFKNNDTGMKLYVTQLELRTTYNLDSGALSRVINGERKSHKGWILLS